ncbi:MAG: septum formation initiator family protein [Syntrophales bacterium]|nr:septum formation initiator family protein [Syntrophales bacterium]MDY0045229.1 septum formation initiator family protein [Syntrophales bacterium]
MAVYVTGGLLIAFGDKGLVDYYEVKARLASLKKVNSSILEENQILKNKILLLRNDLSYIEMIARKELGMIKEGEIVYRFID